MMEFIALFLSVVFCVFGLLFCWLGKRSYKAAIAQYEACQALMARIDESPADG